MPHKFIKIAHHIVPIKIVRSPRSKSIKIRIARGENSIAISAPLKTTDYAIEKFLNATRSWIERHYASFPAQKLLTPGATIPIFGHEYSIHYKWNDCPKIHLKGDNLVVEGFDPSIVPNLTRGLLQDMIGEYLQKRSNQYAKKIQKEIQVIEIKDLKSKWGSCSIHQKLIFNWRLVFAPADVIDYVCAHEVAHLKHMNHSAQFWNLVAELQPDFQVHRQWLKAHTNHLFSYDPR